jgi:hypothetical protein
MRLVNSKTIPSLYKDMEMQSVIVLYLFAQNHKTNILLYTQIEMVNRVAGARKHTGYHNENTNACPELEVRRSKI